MGSHPINLAVRFILEITALIMIGVWGWNQSDDWLRFLLAFGSPIILAAIWGTFAVPNDPSRSGNAPVAVRGNLRLAIELAFFTIATYAIYELGYSTLAIVYGAIVVIHYLISYDRIKWLMKQ